MTGPSDRKPRRPRESGEESEHARAVREVVEDQARRRQAREGAASRSGKGSDTPFFVQVGLLVAVTFFFYLLFFSPTWIAPTAGEPMSARQVEEGLRVSIFLTARQVEAFRQREGQLPADEAQLGLDRPGVSYERVDPGTFRIRASRGQTGLTYVSSQPVEEFAGQAVDEVLGGVR
jgi:hypothetical protein